MRLDKFLSDKGIGTRKELKQWIKNGRVRVNDTVITQNDYHINENSDQITFDDVLLEHAGFRYYMLNKPQGVITATRDRLSDTILDLLAGENTKGLSPVGRLDKDTEGLLLITDDGDLNHRLLSPKKHVDKTYEVHLAVPISDEAIRQLEEGVDIGDEKPTMPARIQRAADTEAGTPVIYLSIQEGRYHQVKRMLEAVDNKVVFLRRRSMGPLVLDEMLAPGDYRRLTEEELHALKAQ